MIRVCHLSSVHTRYDSRILYKECRSLADAGYEVHLVVADGLGEETVHGVRIHDAGRMRSRAMRMLVSTNRVLWHALKLRARVYHFHDSELIPAGILLRLIGRKVIYDVHEDVARSLENRPWVPVGLKKAAALSIESLEYFTGLFFDLYMVVTPEIARRFPAGRTTLLRNFPIQRELGKAVAPFRDRRANVFAYVGTVSPDRGALIMVDAINHPLLRGCARLIVAGAIEPKLIEEMRKRDRLGLLTMPGHIPRAEVAKLLSEARAGLVLLQPVKAHMDAYPIKLFEYMAACLPVIASDYPVWKALLDEGELALLVDPTNPHEIATAMKKILDQPELAEQLALRAAAAVGSRYNWEQEKEALLEAYRRLCGTGSH